MSLLILFPRRPYIDASGAGVGRYRGYSSGEYRRFAEPVVARKPKRKVKALKREDLLEVKSFKEAVKGLSRAKAPQGLKTDYVLGSNEIVESWQELLKPKSIEALEKALSALSPVSQKEAETVVEVVAPEVAEVLIEPEVEPEKPKTLDFTDDELILASVLIREKLRPRPKLEFTDEELILAAFLMKNKRNKK